MKKISSLLILIGISCSAFATEMTESAPASCEDTVYAIVYSQCMDACGGLMQCEQSCYSKAIAATKYCH